MFGPLGNFGNTGTTFAPLSFRSLQHYVRGYKFNHLAINSSTTVVGKAAFTLAAVAKSVVEFIAKWSNCCPPTVSSFA